MSNRSNWLAGLLRNPLSGLDPSWRKALLNPVVSLLVVLLAAQLVAALVLANNARQSQAGDARLLDLPSEQVTRIEISSDDQQVVIARSAEGWVLPRLAGFPADSDRVEQLLSRLTTLPRPLPVGSSHETQRRLKVADDNAERRISLYGDAGELAQLLTGDSPGFRRLYARVAGEEAVYDLPLADFQIASDSDDWVRHEQLRIDADAIERISSSDWTLTRSDDGWQLETTSSAMQAREGSLSASDPGRADATEAALEQPELDRAAVEALVSRIANLSYQGVRMPTASLSQEATGSAAEDQGGDRAAATELGSAETAPTQRSAEPVLLLEIGLQDGSQLSRRVLADRDAGYLLQTDTDPQLYELSEYDLDGLLEVRPEQLLSSRTAVPGEDREEAAPGSADAQAEMAPQPEPEPSAAMETDATQLAEPDATEPAASTASAPAAEPLAEPATTPAAEPSSDRGPGTTGAEMTEDAIDNGGERATDTEATVSDGEQTRSAQEAPIDGSGAKPDSDTATESAVEQPKLRPQQPPAAPQWPYQRHVPPGRQPWPPPGPPQGAPPQPAPAWR